MNKRILRMLVFLFLVPLAAGFCQESSQAEPYSPDEFPDWALDLRRGEIVAIGSFPVAMIVSSLVYQLGRFAWYSYQNGTAEMEYAPWFLSTSTEPRYSDAEMRALTWTGVGLSLSAAVIDFLLGRRDETRIRD